MTVMMKVLASLVLLLAALPSARAADAVVAGEPPAASTDAGRTAVVIPVEGDIKTFLYVTMKRRTEEAVAQGCRLIVYRVKSDGGEVHAAMDMANYVFNLPRDVHTVAFVDEKAYSAAALFCLASDELYMRPRSSIGDCQPIFAGSEGITRAGEKIETVLRERFRTYAKANGYPELLAEAMVSQEIEVQCYVEIATGKKVLMRPKDWSFLPKEKQELFKAERILNHAGNLLTLSADEAQELGFSRGTRDDDKALLAALGCEERMTAVVEPTRSEQVMDFFDAWSYLFLVAAIFLGYMEFKSQTGLFGALAAVCFAAFLLSKFYTGQAGYLELVLFVIGVALIAVEIFIFGFGVAGIVGGLAVFAALVMSMRNFRPEGVINYGILLDSMVAVCGAFLSATLAFLLLLYIFTKLDIPLLPGLILTRTQGDAPEDAPVAAAQSSLLGRTGVVVAPLHPVGKARIGDEVLQVVTCGDWIEAGTPVQICEEEGNRIVVKPIDKKES